MIKLLGMFLIPMEWGKNIQQEKLVPLHSAFVLDVYPGICFLPPSCNS